MKEYWVTYADNWGNMHCATIIGENVHKALEQLEEDLIDTGCNVIDFDEV